MSDGTSRKVQSVKPSQLKIGDTILYKDQQALVMKIGNWRDSVHGVVYGLDLIVRGKSVRASFTESTKVDLLD